MTDKGRFQLFGDTVNTAARMESNGMPGKVQISSQMANLLALAGKSHWYSPREDTVFAKGKGELQCFWLKDHIDKKMLQRKPSMATSIWMHLEDVINMQEMKLQEWNFAVLETLIKKIVLASGQDVEPEADMEDDDSISTHGSIFSLAPAADDEVPLVYEESGGTVLDELSAKASYPVKQASPALWTQKSVNEVVLPAKVSVELKNFFQELFASYQANHFHCFLRACHVARSMMNLLEHLEKSNPLLRNDPLAQLAIIISCIVADVDNPGVSNHQLMKEDEEMASFFHRTCLIQQNALDVAWDLLTGPTCQELLKAICSNSKSELERFRKYMVHAMLAIDLEDKDLRLSRFQRWKCADYMTPAEQSIVIVEQSMQLSEAIHTVQSEDIFLKWAERAFREQYLAYIKARRDQDPCVTFYEEQLEYFREDVLPLTERFNGGTGQGSERRHAILGSCSELQRQAKKNLQIWETLGKQKVEEMSRSAKYEFGEKQVSSFP